MRRAAWVAIGGLVGAALLWTPSRDTLLLRNETGALIPFVLYTAGCLAPALVANLRVAGTGRLARLVERVRPLRREAMAWGALFLVLTVEFLLDPAWTRLLGWDFTPTVRNLEGSAVADIQDALRPSPAGPILDEAFSLIYAYGFSILYGVVPGVALLSGDSALARRLLRVILIVWAVGIPAYLFVPVNEPWFPATDVENVLHTTMPPSQTNPFVINNVNNELPSLHAALSVAIGATLWQAGRRRAALAASPIVLGIPVGVVYLGVHWVTDAVAGVLLGLAAATAATRTRILRWPPPESDSQNRNTPTRFGTEPDR